MMRTIDGRAWATWSRRAVLALVVTSLACASRAPDDEEHDGVVASPIVGGTPSDATQDAVVLVIHSAPGSSEVEVCSGTMLAPNLVLTARHCVAPVDRTVTCTSDGTAVSGGVVSPDFVPSEMFVYGGSMRADLGTVLSVAVSGTQIFDDGASTLCNHDLALVLLAAAVPGAAFAPVRLDGDTNVGEITTIVGWGLDDTGKLAQVRQQRANEPVLAVGPSSEIGLGSAERLIGQGACEGDSGGPALSASGAVIGLLSRGGSGVGTGEVATCADTDIGLYSAPAGFSSLILSAYAAAGQAPWREGQPNPTLPAASVSSSGGGDSSSGCSFAPRGHSGEGAVTAVAVLLVALRRARRAKRPRKARAAGSATPHPSP